MVVVYDKQTGQIIYTVDHVHNPSFIQPADNEGILISEMEYGGKVKDMIVDISGTPKLINKPSEG